MKSEAAERRLRDTLTTLPASPTTQAFLRLLLRVTVSLSSPGRLFPEHSSLSQIREEWVTTFNQKPREGGAPSGGQNGGGVRPPAIRALYLQGSSVHQLFLLQFGLVLVIHL